MQAMVDAAAAARSEARLAEPPAGVSGGAGESAGVSGGAEVDAPASGGGVEKSVEQMEEEMDAMEQEVLGTVENRQIVAYEELTAALAHVV